MIKKLTLIPLCFMIIPFVSADYKIYSAVQSGNAGSVVDLPEMKGSQPVLGTNGFQLDANGVTISCNEASPGDVGKVNGITYTAVDNDTLGNFGYVNECTSFVTDMYYEFMSSDFNGDISSWDTSKVVTMQAMFISAKKFNQDISKWNTSNLERMDNMFQSASSFNQDIGNWDTSNVKIMLGLFRGAEKFNQDLSGWDTGSVTRMDQMFYDAIMFDQDLSGWDVGNVSMFDFFGRNSGFEGEASKYPDFN